MPVNPNLPSFESQASMKPRSEAQHHQILDGTKRPRVRRGSAVSGSMCDCKWPFRHPVDEESRSALWIVALRFEIMSNEEMVQVMWWH